MVSGLESDSKNLQHPPHFALTGIVGPEQKNLEVDDFLNNIVSDYDDVPCGSNYNFHFVVLCVICKTHDSLNRNFPKALFL